MPTITLRKGSATGTEVTFRCGFIDLDELVANTDYKLNDSGEITIYDGKLYVTNGYLAANGFDALDLSEADDLIQPLRWLHDPLPSPDVYRPSGTFTEVPIGVQPDDWALHWRDKYYTKDTRTQGGHEIITYMPLTNDTYNPLVQYYENSTLAALYWTPNKGYFGIRTFYTSTSTKKTAVFRVGSYVSYGTPSQINNNSLSCTLKSLDGTHVCMPGGGSNTYWRPSHTEETTYTTTGPSTLRAVLLVIRLGGVERVALACIGYGIDESINYCGFWLAGDKFWVSDDVHPGTPGNWGHNTNSMTPSPATPASFAVNVGFQPFPTALNAATFAGNHGGLYVWALTNTQYAHVNGCLWGRSFLDRIADLGKNPGDGIIGAHYMPAGYDRALVASDISLYGIRPLFDDDIEVQGYLVSGRSYDVDLGTVKIDQNTGYFSDYNAQAEIYLPFIGFQSLDVKKIMGGTLHLRYRFDIMTGDCVAWLTVSTFYPEGWNDATGTATLLTAHGNAAMSVPYAYTDGGVQSKLGALSGALSAGLAAASGNPAGALGALGSFANMGAENISHSGVTGNAGAMSLLRPFVWIKYPAMITPAKFGDVVGYVSASGGTVEFPEFDDIGERRPYSGFQVYEAVDVDAIPCTAEEAAEIESLLKGGIFV